MKKNYRWALLWRSNNWLDGKTEHIIYEDLLPKLFITRQQARDHRDKKYGYINDRPDLRAEPHGWRMPLPIKITIKRYDDLQT